MRQRLGNNETVGNSEVEQIPELPACDLMNAAVDQGDIARVFVENACPVDNLRVRYLDQARRKGRAVESYVPVTRENVYLILNRGVDIEKVADVSGC